MKPNQDSPDKELLLRVKTIMVLRAAFLTGLVGLVLAFQQRVGFQGPIVPLSIVIGVAYFFCLLHALLFRVFSLRTSACLQVGSDLFVVGGILFTTGGIDSPLSFLYLFVIIATGIMLPRTACYLVASGASILYGLLVDLQYFDIIRPVYLFVESKVSFESGYGFYIIILNIASYYAVAYLSSILSHRLRIVKEELALKSIDLEELQVFHKNVVQNMGNGLITTDLEGRITSINSAGEEITGYLQQECVDRSCKELFSIPALAGFFESPDFHFPSREIQGECQKKDGKTIFIRMKVSHLMGHQQPPKGYILVFEDLTEIKEMQVKISQAEQLAAVGRFSAGLAHEIRNPLASLSGSIQVLSKGLKLDSTYRKLMGIVIRETERLNAIVTDFLNYANPRRNRNTVVDLTQLIQEVITLMKNSEEYIPSVDLIFDRQTDHLLFEGDEQQMKQVVWNLCINALQAMPQGGRLRVTLDRVPSPRNRNRMQGKKGILIMVEDSGGGIPDEHINNIFDPFFTTKENGVGLGLATVYRVVQQNEGTLDVKSSPDTGTRFSIFLPQETVLFGKDGVEPEGKNRVTLQNP